MVELEDLFEGGKSFFGVGVGGVSIFCGCCCCLSSGLLGILFVIFILFMDSIRIVKYDEYAIRYNKHTQKVPVLSASGNREDYVYDGGRYLLFGYGNRFIKFPRIYQSIDFDGSKYDKLSSRTYDGLYVTLDISFQYQLEKQSIPNIFEEFGENFDDIYLKIARDSLRDVASQFNATEFFDRRGAIADEMLDTLTTSLAEFWATVKYLQLKQVDLPDSYESIIEQKEILKQNIEKIEYEKESELITARTEVEVARMEADVIIKNAEAIAESEIIIAQAEANATRRILTAESEAFRELCEEVGFNSTELLGYLWIQAIKEHDENLLTIQLDKPDEL